MADECVFPGLTPASANFLLKRRDAAGILDLSGVDVRVPRAACACVREGVRLRWRC